MQQQQGLPFFGVPSSGQQQQHLQQQQYQQHLQQQQYQQHLQQQQYQQHLQQQQYQQQLQQQQYQQYYHLQQQNQHQLSRLSVLKSAAAAGGQASAPPLAGSASLPFMPSLPSTMDLSMPRQAIPLPWMPLSSASPGSGTAPLRLIQHLQQRPLLRPPPPPLPKPAVSPPRPLLSTPPPPLPAPPSPTLSTPPVLSRNQALTEGEAGLRLDNDRVVLNYSQVPHRAGDLFAHQKRQQLVAAEPAGARGLQQLRPTARFLFDTGLALVRSAYAADWEGAADAAVEAETADLPSVEHLLASFKFRCRSCSFRGDTELSVLLHYQRGHLSEDGVYSCALDRYGTRDAQAFRQHMGRMHCLVGMPEEKPPAYACTFCFFGAATPAVFYRHLPVCTAAAAAAGDGSWQLHPALMAPEPGADLNCCFRLDSLQQFGVSELHGRLVPGTFRGRQIVMPKGSYRPLAAPAATAAASPAAATANEPQKVQQTKPSQQQRQSVGRPDGLFSSRPAPLGSFTPRVAAPLRVRDPGSAAQSQRQPQSQPSVVHCELCNGLCSSAAALAGHLAAAHPDALGGGSVEQRQHLQGRVAAAIASGCGAACPDCGRGFATRRGLEAHRQVGGACPIGRLCAFCQRPFDLARHRLLGHLAERHPRELRSLIARGVCPVCVASTGAAGQLLRHLSSAHGLAVSLGPGSSGAVSFAPRPGAGRAPRDCPACSRCFATDLQLRDHMLAAGHSYRCHRCCKGDAAATLPTKEAWVAHLLREHATDRERCLACPETFQVGMPLTCHLLRSHTRACSVRLKRLTAAEAADAAADGGPLDCRDEPQAKRSRLAAKSAAAL